MGMAAPAYFTAEMVRALPDDGNRYEVVHGELLVTPPADISWTPDTLVQPDLFVAALDEARTGERNVTALTRQPSAARIPRSEP